MRCAAEYGMKLTSWSDNFADTVAACYRCQRETILRWWRYDAGGVRFIQQLCRACRRDIEAQWAGGTHDANEEPQPR